MVTGNCSAKPKSMGAQLLLKHRSKPAKQPRGIVRSRGRFGVILHTENGFGLVTHAFHSLIVEVQAVHNHIRWQTRGVHCKAVVLRRDFHLSGFQVLDRLVAAAVAIL